MVIIVIFLFLGVLVCIFGVSAGIKVKKRADILLVENGFFESREKAKVRIMAGEVLINGQRVVKPSQKFEDGAEILVLLEKDRYVSRGGLKLEGALKDFDLNVKNKKCLDIGASTGGFTDCLLKNGADRVIAMDVGKNILDYAIRNNSRVLVVEGFNARYIDNYSPPFSIDLVTIDVSFISAIKILRPLRRIITCETEVIVLLKPQFELTKPFRGFDGVIRSGGKQVEIMTGFYSSVARLGYYVKDHCFSRIKGPKGNIEFFARLGYGGRSECVDDKLFLPTPYEIVRKAHLYFAQNSRTFEKHDEQ